MRQVTHALLTRPPLSHLKWINLQQAVSIFGRGASFDLHVLSTPPAFILSQDQTLMLIVVWTCQNFFWHSYLCLDSSLNFSLLPSFRSSAFGIFRVALLFICQGALLLFFQRQLWYHIIGFSLCQQLFKTFFLTGKLCFFTRWTFNITHSVMLCQ